MPSNLTLFHNMKKLPIARFSWHADTKTLTAFDSDLSDYGKFFGYVSRLYLDACDEGIAIHNPETGKTEIFFLGYIDRHEGDIRYYVFTPIDKNSRVNNVTIYND